MDFETFVKFVNLCFQCLNKLTTYVTAFRIPLLDSISRSPIIIGSHSFIGRKNLKVLFLNNSNIESILNYTFYGLRQLSQLHLESNNIRRIEGHEFQSLRGN